MQKKLYVTLCWPTPTRMSLFLLLNVTCIRNIVNFCIIRYLRKNGIVKPWKKLLRFENPQWTLFLTASHSFHEATPNHSIPKEHQNLVISVWENSLLTSKLYLWNTVSYVLQNSQWLSLLLNPNGKRETKKEGYWDQWSSYKIWNSMAAI